MCSPCLSGAGASLAECSQVLLNDTEICSDCTSASGATVVCTNTNVNDDPQVCDTCLMPDLVTTEVCTESNIDFYDDADSDDETCVSEGHGAASTWDGEADCCSDSQSGTGPRSCVTLYGVSYTNWGGETDCCTNSLSGSTSTCVSLIYGVPGSWGGVVDCCSNYWDTVAPQNYAVCR